MPRMLSFTFVQFAALSFLLQATNAINACPSADFELTGSGGINYRICPGTDLEGHSVAVTNGVQSVEACARLCDKALSCFKAVYDNKDKVCHFKTTATLKWVANSRFQTIQVEQINIARCPYNQVEHRSNGQSYQICPYTDIRGPSAQIIKGLKSRDACVQKCSTTNTCVQAVWDSAVSVCHIKADATRNTLIWSTDKRFDVIRRDIPSNPAIDGAWSDMIRLPVIPVAAYVVPAYPESQRLLVFSSWAADAFGGASGRTQFADYNFVNGKVSARTVANTKHDMFCPAISSLEDGRILIQGGSDASVTSFYHPDTNEFTRGPDMKMPRGYQTSVTLSNGNIFTIGGAYSGPRQGKDGEVYDAKTNTWKALPSAKARALLTVDHEGIWREDNHAWLFGWKNGTVFQAGPSKAMNWYGADNVGFQTPAGTRDSVDAMCGVFVMYEPGKILTAAGAPDYTNSDANNRVNVITIDEPGKMPTVQRVDDLKYPRGFSNAVVLPDGTVLVTGGQRRSLVFTDTDGILYPELYNPTTRKWKVLAPEAVPRNYHSVSILLSDGTVFSGGGGLCYAGNVGASTVNCNKLVDHADGQVFSPPYLFNRNGSPAVRPKITDVSAQSIPIGGTITITTATKNPAFVLIRIGSVTHSVNSDQRRVPLTNVRAYGSKYTATLPNDSGILIPGSYYLFLIDDKGVPSIARTVRITLNR